MRYECSYYPNLNTIEVSTHGVANIAALIEMLHRIAELCGQEKSANILVDHSELDASPLTMNNIDTISRITVSMKDISMQGSVLMLYGDFNLALYVLGR
jgi:hypothetical protein